MLDSIFKVINKEKFNDEVLNRLQSDISNYGLVGIKEINKVKEIESYNKFFLTYILFNGLFSINILIIYYYKKFIDNYGIYFSKSVDALEDFEVFTSLAILGQTKKVITLPSAGERIKINFDNLKHPLITEKDCVPNSFNHESNINIITGSNMSGKTSFLRTIGINIILMNAGAYCNAESFSSPYLRVFTSMRIADDIAKGVSTFYAELLRIKAAIEYSKENKPMIILIDEIFKGTNSNDRIQGAISLIEKLNKNNIIIFISTHDFELCEIKSVDIRNYHFTEYYEEDKIKFYYKLMYGKCHTTNAKYLMKIAGIID
jgi:DNA mismatch repair ATPase MutS